MQHTVHILVAIGAAKALGQLDAFVQHHAPRHIKTALKLVSTDPQNAVLNRRQLNQRTVQQRRDQRVQRAGLRYAAVQQRVEMHAVGFVKTRQVAGEEVDVFWGVAAHQMLVKRLQGELARAGAGRFVGRLAGLGGRGCGGGGASGV